MLATLAVAIPAGLHVALSVALGYAVRYADGLPPEAKTFSLFGFIFAAILAAVVIAMVLFFGGTIPTMLYSMGMVHFMLRWAGKRRGKVKLTSTVISSVLGLICGILGSALLALLMSIRPSWALYVTVFRWPEIMTVDGIVLLWTVVNPFAQAIAGAQIGWRLGKQIELISLYWFW
jgi:hypothetical protein